MTIIVNGSDDTKVIGLEHVWGQNTNLDHLDDVLNDPCQVLIGTMLFEVPPVSRGKSTLTHLISRAKSLGKTFILVINSWYKPYEQSLRECGVDDVVFIDLLLVWVYQRLVEKEESLLRESWNANHTHWLFLTGKANKANRLPLLYQFYKHDLLDKCQWSLFVTERIQKNCQELLYDLTRNEAEEWLKRFSQSPDNIEVVDSENGTHYSGIPYGNIYDSCLFQVVPETSFVLDNPLITEKTWLPIINRTPFLILGDPGTSLKLKSMGFKTFDDLLCDNNFDKNYALSTRIESLIKNIRHWLENLHKYESDVRSITEHNHQRLLELFIQNIKTIQQLCSRHNIKITIGDLLGPADGRDPITHAKWKNYYARIKDPSWPDCDYEEDFKNLPEWIQEECIHVFGYQPKESK